MLLVDSPRFVLSYVGEVLSGRDNLATLAGSVEDLRGSCRACIGRCATLGRCSLHCGWARGCLGREVNKRHERPINEWIKRGPSGRAPLSVVEDGLKVRKWIYVPFSSLKGPVPEIQLGKVISLKWTDLSFYISFTRCGHFA